MNAESHEKPKKTSDDLSTSARSSIFIVLVGATTPQVDGSVTEITVSTTKKFSLIEKVTHTHLDCCCRERALVHNEVFVRSYLAHISFSSF